MDILLRKKYSYPVPTCLDDTKMEVENILNNKWYDLSKNWYGKIQDDGTFTFNQKISFGGFSNFGRTVYFSGNFKKDGDYTIINITLSPNVILVLVFYLLPLLWLNILLGDNSLMGQNSRLNNFLIILWMELIFFTIVQIGSYFLKRKFEKVVISRMTSDT